MAKKADGGDPDVYYDALETLRAGTVPPILVIAGTEELFRRKALESLFVGVRVAAPHAQEVVFHGPGGRNESSLSVGAVLAEVQSRSLFAAQKLVLVRQAQLFLFPQKGEGDAATGKGATPEDALLAYLDQPAEGMFLVFETESLNRARRVGKALDAKAHVIHCPVLKWERDVIAWLRRAVREFGKTMAPAAMSMLFLAHGASPGAIWQELEKLSLFVGDRDEIDAEAVRAFMGDSVAFSLFELSGAVEERDGAKALALTRRIVEQGVSDGGKAVDTVGSVHMALGTLHTCLLGIWQAQDVLRAGGGQSALEERLGAARFRARFLLDAGRKYSGAELATAFVALADGIASLHDTGADPALTLDRVVHGICAPKRGGARG